MSLCIRGARLLPLDGTPERANATIVIEGDRITAVGGPAIAAPDGARVLSGSGCIALPGLVNCHNHVAMTLFRGYGADVPLQQWLQEYIWPAEERLTDDDVRVGAMLGCLEMLRGGITAFADMYDHMEAVADAVEQSGIRGVLSRGVIGLRPTWQAALSEGEALCARARRSPSGRVTAMIAPHAEYTCPPEVWREAIAVARREGVPLHTHVSETAGENEGCRQRHGCSPVRFLHDVGALQAGCLLAHCVHVDAADMRLLAVPGVFVSHNPVSNAKLGSGIAPVPEMLAAGVRLGVGSDGAASTDVLGLWEELRLAAWQQKAHRMDASAMPCTQLLRMASTDGARAVRLGDGGVAAGAVADLILVDTRSLHQTPVIDPVAALVYGTRDADVAVTIVAGRVVMERGEFPGIDHERLRADAVACSRRLLEAV